MKAGEACLELGAADVVVADTASRQKDIWSVRRAIGEAVKKIATYKEEDTVVPRRQVPALISSVREVIDRHGLRAICYGHAGDGNIHVNILLDKNNPEEVKNADAAVKELFGRVIEMGGTISGEHGIGITKAPYLEMEIPVPALQLMSRLKRAFDPLDILNPGKIFP